MGKFGADVDREIDRRIVLAREWDDLVAQVRALGPEFREFLRPPGIATLTPPKDDGTAVIVNVAPTRCDALLVSREGTRSLPLPDLTVTEVTDRATRHLMRLHDLDSAAISLHRARWRCDTHPGGESFYSHYAVTLRVQKAQRLLDDELSDTLEWLWEVLAQPVVSAVAEYRGELPSARLWWCPTGALAFLPLHAAGRRDRDGESVLDRAVSSYTPTLRALTSAARPAPRDQMPPRLLVVAVPEYPGGPVLPQAADEIAMLRERVPAEQLTVLDGPAATRDAVRRALATHRWVHFSCHGRQDLDNPARGGLSMHDGLLTVADISHGRHQGELAFLSACMTATGAPALSDEVITLAASMHFTGFRHVLATLWSVDADVAMRVADAVFGELIADGEFAASRSAAALHDAVRACRADDPQRPSRWAVFTHTGP